MRRTIAPARAARLLACAPVLLVSAAACIDTGRNNSFYFVDTTLVDYVADGDDTLLRITATLEASASEARILDSALITVNAGGTAADYDDPDVAYDDQVSVFGSPGIEVALSIPSPFTDIDELDSFCGDNGRSADVTLRFYERENDRDPDADPPLTLVAYTASLVRAGLPAPTGIFGSLGLSASSVVPIAPALGPVSQPDGGRVAFVAEASTEGALALYDADEDSLRLAGTLGGSFSELPVVVPTPDGGFVTAGVGSEQAISISGLDPGAFQRWSRALLVSGQPDPALSALHASGLFKKGPNLLLVGQSSYQLVDDGGVLAAPLDPPAGKFYGGLRAELDPDGNLVSASLGDRDLLHYVELADGGRVEVSTDVPPRSAEAVLRVERYDATDTLVWTHEETLLSYRVSVDVDATGGLVLAVENSEFGALIDVFRLDASDGSVVFHYTASGRGPSVAFTPSGTTLLGFVGAPSGVVPGPQVSLPDRGAPVIVELDAAGAVVRAAQVACAGTPVLTGDQGKVLLVGSFRDKVTLGDSARDFTQNDGFQITVGAAIVAGTVE